MKFISYNSSVAKACGKNGIIKASLLNYIYNYHRTNSSKGCGYPASISLAEFVYQYRVNDVDGLWKRSFIHKILMDMVKEGRLLKTGVKNSPTFAVSPEIVVMLTDRNAIIISFELGMAVNHGIDVAIMHRYLLHVIDQSPEGMAYNLSVKKMSELNRISHAQIYRAISWLEENEIVQRVQSPVLKYSRALCLARTKPNHCQKSQKPVT